MGLPVETLVVLLVVALAVFFTGRRFWRAWRRGRETPGCAACTPCGGEGCGSCAVELRLRPKELEKPR